MKLNLTKPLVIFDLETTGLDLVKDRIIQISYIKVSPDGTEERVNHFVNPQRTIPPEVVALTGITNEQVANAPTFEEIAQELHSEFAGFDFAGFTANHFEIPVLAEAFLRAGIAFNFFKCRLIDAQAIFHKMERRNLAAAYKFYCGRKMEDDFQAHLADQDTEATYRVLQGQLDMYNPQTQAEEERQMPNDMDALAALSKMNDNLDFAGRIVLKPLLDGNGQPQIDADGKPRMHPVFNFGKHKGEDVMDVFRSDPSYYSWMQNSDFTLNTKQIVTRIYLRWKNGNK